MEQKPTYETKIETRALTVVPQLTPDVWRMIEAIGPAMHKARLFGVSNPEQAMAIMLKGYELGLSLTASFEFIHAITVGGRTQAALSPRGHLALIVNNPLCKSINIEDQQDKAGNPTACTVTMERTNGFSYSVTVTMDEARRAGLVKPGSGWEKWPANMLRWRATGFCADVVFGDIGGGMKRTDELGAEVTAEGDTVTIDNDWLPPVAQEPEAPTFNTIEDLLSAGWTADEIFNANQDPETGIGRIPGTVEEVRAVAEKLGASNG